MLCVETGIQGNVTTLTNGVTTFLIAPRFCHNDYWFVRIKNSRVTVYLFKENISKQQNQFGVVKLSFWRSSSCLGHANQDWPKPLIRNMGGLRKKRYLLPIYVSGITMVSSWRQASYVSHIRDGVTPTWWLVLKVWVALYFHTLFQTKNVKLNCSRTNTIV